MVIQTANSFLWAVQLCCVSTDLLPPIKKKEIIYHSPIVLEDYAVIILNEKPQFFTKITDLSKGTGEI